MSAFRVVKAYESAFSDPLVVHRGARLRLEKRDTVWPGWLWARIGGKSGWVPEEWMTISGDEGVLERDYDATELTVPRGATVEGTLEVAGWLWATDARGASGWVPLEHLDRRD